MDVTVLVPLSGDCPHRQAAWDWVRPRYPWPVRIGSCQGEWSKSRAIMGAAGGCGEIIVIADADCWTDGIFEAVEAVQGGAPWAMGHRKVHRLTETATGQVLDGTDPSTSMPTVEAPYTGVKGGGIVAVRKEVLLDVPWDSRFVGWGGADTSWRAAMTTLHGNPARTDDPLFHLFHPPLPRVGRATPHREESRRLRERYEHARFDRVLMRQLLREAQ